MYIHIYIYVYTYIYRAAHVGNAVVTTPVQTTIAATPPTLSAGDAATPSTNARSPSACDGENSTAAPKVTEAYISLR